MTSKLIIAASALAVAGAASAWHEAHVTRVAVVAIASSNERQSRANATLVEAQARLAELAAEHIRLQAELTRASDATATPPRAAAVNTQPSARSFTNPFNTIHEDPRLQSRWFAARRAALRATYGPFFRTDGRTEDELVKFTDIAIRREESNLDLSATMWKQHLTKTDAALMAAEERVKVDYDEAVANLLGPAGAQRMRDYELALPARKIVTALAGVAATAGHPLSADQAEQLTALLAELSGRYVRTGATDVQMIDWTVADRRAREILSPAQLTLFQTVEPEDGFNLATFRFGSRAAALTNQAKRLAAGLSPVSSPPTSNAPR